MEIRYCKKCQRMFNDMTGRVFCPSCTEELANILKEVKEYIKENKVVGVPEVSKKFNVPAKRIFDWIAEGEIELTKDSSIKIYCSNCEKQILSGKYCDKCKTKMLNEMNGISRKQGVILNESPKSRENKMRFLDHYNK